MTFSIISNFGQHVNRKLTTSAVMITFMFISQRFAYTLNIFKTISDDIYPLMEMT